MQDGPSHAYEIKELYQLRKPLPLLSMQKDYSVSFPQKFAYAPLKLLDAIVLSEQLKLF